MKFSKFKWYYLILILLTGFGVWYFSNIVAYILISFVLSMMGQPLVRLLDRMQVKKIKIPHALSSFLALSVIWGVIFGLFYIFVPLVSYEAKAISKN